MRKKRELQRFANYCFGRCGVRPIPVVYANAPCVSGHSGDFGFGCYTYGGERKIYVAYKPPKCIVMTSLAHEIWHYRQDCDMRIDLEPAQVEAEAETVAERLVSHWRKRGWRLR